jgi:hypothetical protein
MTRDEQVASICRFIEAHAGLESGSVKESTSLNFDLGFDGDDLFELLEGCAKAIGCYPSEARDFNAFNSGRNSVYVALYYPVALVLNRLWPGKFAQPILPSAEVESLTPDRLRDILCL